MKYTLKVKIRNKIFIVKRKPVRTPCVINNLNEVELRFYKNKLMLEGILDDDYEIIEDNNKNNKTKFNVVKPRDMINHNNCFEYEDEDDSILNKILNENDE